MNLQDRADKVKDTPPRKEKSSKAKTAVVVEVQSVDEEDDPPQKQTRKVGRIELFPSMNAVCEFAGSREESQR